MKLRVKAFHILYKMSNVCVNIVFFSRVVFFIDFVVQSCITMAKNKYEFEEILMVKNETSFSANQPKELCEINRSKK